MRGTGALRHAALMGLMFLVLAVPARAETDRVSLGLPAEAMQFIGYYVAEDLGFFAQQDLEVKKVFLAGVASFNAVVSGSVEFALASGASLTRAAAHGQTMLAIAQLNNRPPWDIVVRKEIAEAAHFDSGAPLATRAHILEGKTITVQGINALDHAYLKIVARIGGVDPDAMTVSALAPPDTLAAFARKAIDGFASGPPWAQQVEDEGTAVAIAVGPNGEPNSIMPLGSSLVVTRPQLCTERRAICVKMGHAMVLAAAAIHDRPQDVVAILKKRFSAVKDTVVARSFDALVKGIPRMPAVDPKALRNADEVNVNAGFLKPEDLLKSYENLSTDEFLR